MEQEGGDAQNIINNAVEYVQHNVNTDPEQPRLRLEAEIVKVEVGNEFDASIKLCELLDVRFLLHGS